MAMLMFGVLFLWGTMFFVLVDSYIIKVEFMLGLFFLVRTLIFPIQTFSANQIALSPQNYLKGPLSLTSLFHLRCKLSSFIRKLLHVPVAVGPVFDFIMGELLDHKKTEEHSGM
jgi:hypothetical protein